MSGSNAIPARTLALAVPDAAERHESAADDTAALTRAAARGDTAAFGTIYERWFDRALSAAHRLTGRDEAFCLDVVQDAMLRAARRIPSLPSEAALGAWLCRVVHRAALDRLRAERRRAARERTAQDAARTAPERTPPESLDDEIAWLRERLRQLPPDEGWLLGARFVRGRTLAQVGDALGLTGDAAHGRIRRVLRRVARLAPHDPHAPNDPDQSNRPHPPHAHPRPTATDRQDRTP